MSILTLLGVQEMLIKQRGAALEVYKVADATDVDIVADILPVTDLAFTLVAQPTFPARLLFTVTNAGAAITSLDVTIVGFDEDGSAVSESLSLDNSGSGGTHEVASVAFMTVVTSLTLGTLAGGDGDARVKVGTALLAATDFNTVRPNLWHETSLAAADWIATPAGVRSVHVFAIADQVTDASGVVIEQSRDGTTVHKTAILTDEDGSRTVSASTRVDRWVPIVMPYWRFRWQCGATGQAVFEVSVIMSAKQVEFRQPLVISGTSGSGSAQTVSVPASDYEREIKQIMIKYSAAFTGTLTVTLNSALGGAFDTLIQNVAMSAARDAVVLFEDQELSLAADDALDVLAPLLASQTSSVAVYAEEVG